MPPHLHFRHTKFRSDKMAAKYISELMNIQAYTLPNLIPFLLIYFHLPHFHVPSRSPCLSQLAKRRRKWKFLLQLSDLSQMSSVIFSISLTVFQNLTALNTSSLTPYNNTHLDKRTDPQLVQKFRVLFKMKGFLLFSHSPPQFVVLSQTNPVRKTPTPIS